MRRAKRILFAGVLSFIRFAKVKGLAKKLDHHQVEIQREVLSHSEQCLQNSFLYQAPYDGYFIFRAFDGKCEKRVYDGCKWSARKKEKGKTYYRQK